MFKLYTQPPYSKMGPFGDFYDAPAELSRRKRHRLISPRFTTTNTTNGMPIRWAWWSKPGSWDSSAFCSIPETDSLPSTPGSAVGTPLPGYRLGSDASTISAIKTAYNSCSKAARTVRPKPQFADQNTFTLEAYGTPLAIPTGHRPWSGSNHHFQWTKTTQAHNGILVGGKGQKIQSIDAKGDLIAFLHGKSFDYTAGDAVPAYDGLLEHFVRHAPLCPSRHLRHFR